eukprot:scaffold1326_cov296-Prasinococcus_capsulatus_cf.AAC.11
MASTATASLSLATMHSSPGTCASAQPAPSAARHCTMAGRIMRRLARHARALRAAEHGAARPVPLWRSGWRAGPWLRVLRARAGRRPPADPAASPAQQRHAAASRSSSAAAAPGQDHVSAGLSARRRKQRASLTVGPLARVRRVALRPEGSVASAAAAPRPSPLCLLLLLLSWASLASDWLALAEPSLHRGCTRFKNARRTALLRSRLITCPAIVATATGTDVSMRGAARWSGRVRAHTRLPVHEGEALLHHAEALGRRRCCGARGPRLAHAGGRGAPTRLLQARRSAQRGGCRGPRVLAGRAAVSNAAKQGLAASGAQHARGTPAARSLSRSSLAPPGHDD